MRGRGVGLLRVEGEEGAEGPEGKGSDSSYTTPQNSKHHPYAASGGGSSQIGGTLRRTSRPVALRHETIISLKELQGELKKIHKMISVWDGLIKKMRGHAHLEGDEKKLFQNLQLANEAQERGNQLRSSFEANLISSRDVYVELMGVPSVAAGVLHKKKRLMEL